jgi:uncharacterized protein
MNLFIIQGMKRLFERCISEYLEYFPVVAVLGVRQAGKSTTISELPKDWRKLDLEKAADYDEIARDPDAFFRLNPTKIAIDEAQLLPELFPALRVAVDDDRSITGRFIITGSSSPDLNDRISESLAGRIGTIEMSPLLFLETTSNQESSFISQLLEKKIDANALKESPRKSSHKNLQRYWFEGGYPEPWIKNDSRFRSLWFDNYVANYLRRDLSHLFPKLDYVRYRRFLGILAGLSGTIINLSRLGQSLDISQPTAKDYLDIAHHTFVWRKLLPYDRNTKKRIVKHPKGYMRDSGLMHYMLRIPDHIALQDHPQMGASWEGLVIEEILRRLNAAGIPFDSFFYRTSAGAEVDLILEGDFGLIPIEIKYAQRETKNLRSLNDFVKEHGCQIGIVINNDDSVKQYSEKVIGIPFLNL